MPLFHSHGPECPLSTPLTWSAAHKRLVRRDCPGIRSDDCACVACYCGPRYERGWMGSCARCHRPLIVDGKVVR